MERPNFTTVKLFTEENFYAFKSSNFNDFILRKRYHDPCGFKTFLYHAVIKKNKSNWTVAQTNGNSFRLEEMKTSQCCNQHRQTIVHASELFWIGIDLDGKFGLKLYTYGLKNHVVRIIKMGHVSDVSRHWQKCGKISPPPPPMECASTPYQIVDAHRIIHTCASTPRLSENLCASIWCATILIANSEAVLP